MHAHRETTGADLYLQIADSLQERIVSGEWEQGAKLPPLTKLMEQYDTAKDTIRHALAELEDRGFVVLHDRSPARVRSRNPIRLPVSRYGQVLAPGGDKGPWETACAQQGIDGEMRLVSVTWFGRQEEGEEPTPEHVAELLRSERAVCRYRNAFAQGEVIQLQRAWYSADLARRTPLGTDGKIVGGTLGALAGVGIYPSHGSEQISVDFRATPEERKALSIGARVPVLRVRRVSYCGDDPYEVVDVVAPADRIELVYDQLPLHGG